MMIGVPKGHTRLIGKSQRQAFVPLQPLILDEKVNGPNTPAMETVWFPTMDELMALNAGAPVLLTVLGRVHPPVMVGVGDKPE